MLNWLFYSIFLLGFSDSGKKELLDIYLDNKSNSGNLDAIGIDIRYKHIVRDNKNIQIKFIDTPNQERFKSISKNYIERFNGIILICDVTNRESFSRFQWWLDDVKEIAQEVNIEVIIIANKIDLENERQISENELEELGKENKVAVFNASSKTGEGVHEAFNYLITKLINNKDIWICE